MTRRGDRDLHGALTELLDAATRAGATLCMSAEEAESASSRFFWSVSIFWRRTPSAGLTA